MKLSIHTFGSKRDISRFSNGYTIKFHRKLKVINVDYC